MTEEKPVRKAPSPEARAAGDRIRALIKRLGLTQDGLAAAAGLPRELVNKIVNGRALLNSANVLDALARALCLTNAQLVAIHAGTMTVDAGVAMAKPLLAETRYPNRREALRRLNEVLTSEERMAVLAIARHGADLSADEWVDVALAKRLEIRGQPVGEPLEPAPFAPKLKRLNK